MTPLTLPLNSSVIKKMKNNRTLETSGMTAIKCLKDGIKWLHAILNVSKKQKILLQDLKESELLALCKQKEDVMQCGNYSGVKLL